MGTMALRKHSNHLVRCDLCQKVTHDVYDVEIGGMRYKFCSDMHATQALANFNKNIELGRKPYITEAPEEPIEVGDSLGFAE